MRQKILTFSLICLLSLSTAALAGGPPPHAGKGNQGHRTSGKSQEKRPKGNPSGKYPPGQQGSGKDMHGKGHPREFDENDLARAGITALTARQMALHGGWTGYKPLPPGIAKNLARGKPLPPGIAKKALPLDMRHRLPSYPGYEWYAVGRDLVLVSIGTMLIADVLHSVFD